VLIRTSTERPEVLDKGTIVIGGITEKDIVQAVELSRAMWNNKEQRNLAPDYLDENVSVKVVKIIQSYPKVINMFVWSKF
jgi:UDP-N-acetylglucosamine 2-epimerase (non-hydrolysing)